MSEEKLEKLGQKMETRITLKAAKCAGGLHIKLPPIVVDRYTLETGDRIDIWFRHVRYCNVREIPKI